VFCLLKFFSCILHIHVLKRIRFLSWNEESNANLSERFYLVYTPCKYQTNKFLRNHSLNELKVCGNRQRMFLVIIFYLVYDCWTLYFNWKMCKKLFGNYKLDWMRIERDRSLDCSFKSYIFVWIGKAMWLPLQDIWNSKDGLYRRTCG
jgi:hypothetical protein